MFPEQLTLWNMYVKCLKTSPFWNIKVALVEISNPDNLRVKNRIYWSKFHRLNLKLRLIISWQNTNWTASLIQSGWTSWDNSSTSLDILKIVRDGTVRVGTIFLTLVVHSIFWKQFEMGQYELRQFLFL